MAEILHFLILPLNEPVSPALVNSNVLMFQPVRDREIDLSSSDDLGCEKQQLTQVSMNISLMTVPPVLKVDLSGSDEKSVKDTP